MKEKTYEEVLDEIISDKINNPNHYQGAFGLEAIEVVRNFAGDLTAVEGFYWGNAIKYMLRFQKKNGLDNFVKLTKEEYPARLDVTEKRLQPIQEQLELW